jgi:hypothetical protein
MKKSVLLSSEDSNKEILYDCERDKRKEDKKEEARLFLSSKIFME